tara:strand:+ start:138 stop:533 length:396 start_codon:yes stop_codon:yes gene_type:complete
MIKILNKGFALVEVVIVIVLVSGSFLVFLEALSQAKSLQLKSEIVTIQSMLLSSKINQLRANGFNNLPQSHGYQSFTDYPNYSYSITCSYINEQLQPSDTYTDYKLIELNVKHDYDSYPIISESFIITNAI